MASSTRRPRQSASQIPSSEIKTRQATGASHHQPPTAGAIRGRGLISPSTATGPSFRLITGASIWAVRNWATPKPNATAAHTTNVGAPACRRHMNTGTRKIVNIGASRIAGRIEAPSRAENRRRMREAQPGHDSAARIV